jgi:gamma-glutamylcyclotransferase
MAAKTLVEKLATASAEPFFWFIYGSSLDLDAFKKWADQHGERVPEFATVVPARLDGHRLSFDVQSRFWGGAVASVAEAPGAHVEGIAVQLAGEARGLVDRKEGAANGLYEPTPVVVAPLDGGAPIQALAFRGVASKRLPAEQTPAPTFLDALVRGARAQNLSPAWIEHLESLRRGQ